MENQIFVLLLTLLLFCAVLRQRMSLKALVISIIAGILTLIGELQSDVSWLTAALTAIITFMMWYTIIEGVVLAIRFLRFRQD